MNSILPWLISTTVTTALLVPVVWLLCRVFRHRPSVQHLFWLVLFLKFITPALGISVLVLPDSLPKWLSRSMVSTVGESWAVARQSRTASTALSTTAPRTTETDSTSAALADPWLAAGGSASAPLETGGAAAASVRDGSPTAWTSPAMLVGMIWVAGGCVVWVRAASRIRRQARLIRQGSAAPGSFIGVVRDVAQRMGLRPIPVSLVTGIGSPFIWCFGRLQLIWPRPLAAHEFDRATRLVIAHELSHVGRRDHWIAWLEVAALAIWWWNPVYWLVVRNLRLTAELACDTLALEAFPADRGLYAETLLALSISKSGVPALGLAVGAGTPSSLERRISMMMCERVSGKLSRTGVVAAVLLALSPVMSVAQTSLQENLASDDAVAAPAAEANAPAADKSAAEAEQLRALLAQLESEIKAGNLTVADVQKALLAIGNRKLETRREAAIRAELDAATREEQLALEKAKRTHTDLKTQSSDARLEANRAQLDAAREQLEAAIKAERDDADAAAVRKRRDAIRQRADDKLNEGTESALSKYRQDYLLRTRDREQVLTARAAERIAEMEKVLQDQASEIAQLKDAIKQIMRSAPGR